MRTAFLFFFSDPSFLLSLLPLLAISLLFFSYSPLFLSFLSLVMIAVFSGSPLLLFPYSSFLFCLPPFFVLLSSLFLITSPFLFFPDSAFLLGLFPMRTAFLLLFSYSPFLPC